MMGDEGRDGQSKHKQSDVRVFVYLPHVRTGLCYKGSIREYPKWCPHMCSSTLRIDCSETERYMKSYIHSYCAQIRRL